MREVSKTAATSVLEFVSGLEADTPLSGSMKTQSLLHPELVRLRESKGRVGRELRLPPDWDKDGYYELTGPCFLFVNGVC